jgi:hypothetical protein
MRAHSFDLSKEVLQPGRAARDAAYRPETRPRAQSLFFEGHLRMWSAAICLPCKQSRGQSWTKYLEDLPPGRARKAKVTSLYPSQLLHALP